ncbi:outer membrane autotransporter protein [Ochrobactrum sp. BH3]|nr:outer membrane autotransporter protein [Ochrobactrum sp. BH3]
MSGIQINGSSSGNLGEIIVSGTGSMLTSNSAISIGTFDPGQLTITNGAQVNATRLSIGDLSSVTVSGSGSSWTGEKGVWVGSSGFAQLDVNDGASINDTVLQIAPNGGSIGIVNIGGAEGQEARHSGTLNVGSIVFNQNGDDDDFGIGVINFNTTDGTSVRADISGKGTIQQIAGETIFSGNNSTFEGKVIVTGGAMIQAAENSFSPAVDYEVGADGLMNVGGYRTTVASLSNNGTVILGYNPGSVITVGGNYTSNNGTVIMNAELNGDNSRTDILQVDGDTSGSSTVKMINRGGLGAQTNEGIRIIEVKGQSNGKFNLVGDYITKDGQQAVVAGAYAYSLYAGGVNTPDDGDWYLRSELKDATGPIINPGIPLYQGAVQAMQMLNKLPTLRQRLGNRYWDGAANPVIEQGTDAIGTPLVSASEAGSVVDGRGIWGRIEGAHSRFKPNSPGMKQDINTYLLQAGVDGQFYEGENGMLLGGITGQYGKAHSDISSTQSDGDVDTQGWGIGATLTWYGDNGFYVDTQAQANWYDNDFNSTTANKSLANGRKGFGYALSAEAGQRIDLNDNWSLTPQAQLMWSSIDFDGFNDVFDAAVSLRNGDSLTGRVGISADYRTAWRDANGQLSRASVYGVANLYQEMRGGMSVRVAGNKFDTGSDKTWGGIGAGGTYAWADDKYALYGEGSLNTSLNNFADSYALKATVSFRTKW